jgi:hypothetical protein
MKGEPKRIVPHQASLEYPEDERRDYARLVGMLRREGYGDSTEAVVLRALREAAARA